MVYRIDMAAIASLTPVPAYSLSYTDISRRPLTRSFGRSAANRPQLRRASPRQIVAREKTSRKESSGDSSDDDDLAPVKLSAEARAILGDDASQISESPRKSSEPVHESRQRPLTTTQRLVRSSRSPTPVSTSPVPRVVRIRSGERPAPIALNHKDGSFQYRTSLRAEEVAQDQERFRDSVTPAPRVRRIRVSGSREQTKSPLRTSPQNSLQQSQRQSPESDLLEYKQEGKHATYEVEDQDEIPIGLSNVSRTRHGEDRGLQSTARVRRIGTGTLLSGPVRRGPIRRQSEEENIPQHRELEGPRASGGPIQISRDHDERDTNPHIQQRHMALPSRCSPAPKEQDEPESHVVFASSAEVVSEDSNEDIVHEKLRSPPQSSSVLPRSTPASDRLHQSLNKSASSGRPQSVFKLPLPTLPSAQDQENEPPPTFKRDKPSTSILRVHAALEEDILTIPLKPSATKPTTILTQQSPAARPALAQISSNTPHRVAPAPPPVMSVLDAATSVAGSTKRKSEKNQIRFKSKPFTRMEVLGKGGSSVVYRVMAENYRCFALKRVNLKDADEHSIAGFRGEIDLLKRLDKVERVVRLIDYHVDEGREKLLVLMEIGESDFNRVLNLQVRSEGARLDLSFTRHYWREMLECVDAVHRHDIVHSDLKPANFLLVGGRLKLIDFGIANAIGNNTVNVHRENTVGTPNYMSPESLVSQHGAAAAGSQSGKILKLGKPSDVWSLGCILYQLTYGEPPFNYIKQQFERIMSIPNPKVTIRFPETGMGGVPVPPSLVRTLKRCLQRDQTLRPTIAELLSEDDAFLNPDGGDRCAITREMLAQVITGVLRECRKGGRVPEEGVAMGWADKYFEGIRSVGQSV